METVPISGHIALGLSLIGIIVVCIDQFRQWLWRKR